MTRDNIYYDELFDTWEFSSDELDKFEKEIRAEAEAEHKAMCESCIHKVSADDIEAIRNSAIDEYSNKLWQVIEKTTVNCKFDFTIDDLHNLEIVIKGLAEEMKEGKE